MLQHSIKGLFLLMLLSLLTISCKKSIPEEPVVHIDKIEFASGTSLQQTVPAEENTITIAFSATSAWSAQAINDRADGWCSITPSAGNAGQGAINITSAANPDPAERSASVVIYCGSISQTIKITQKEKNTIIATASTIEVPADGMEINIEVKANVSLNYAVSDNAKEWLKYVGTKALTTSNLTFVADKNESISKREAQVIIYNGSVADTVNIYQHGETPAIILTKDEYIIKAEGETFDVEVASNVNASYSIEYQDESANWLQENTTRSLSTNTFHFVAASNALYEQRSAKIIFHNKENNLADTVKVIQLQKDTIMLEQSIYEIGSDGGTITMPVAHNIDYQIEIKDDWIEKIETKALATDSISFNILRNSSNESREGIVTFKGADGKICHEATIRQSGEETLIITPKEIIVESKGGTVTIDIKTNVEFSVADPNADWIHQIKTKGLEEHTLKYQIDENNGYDSRSAKVAIKNIKSGNTEYVTITQLQKDAIVIAKKSYNVDYKGGNIEVEVKHNVGFTYNIGAKWITAIETKALTKSTILFQISKNNTEKARESSITFTSKDKKISQTIKIKQGAKEVVQTGPAANEIWYTSNDGNIVELFKTTGFEASIISNTYTNGRGTITFDKDIDHIGDWAFYNCSSLTSINFSNKVTSIGDWAFYKCIELTSAGDLSGITKLGKSAFYYCENLTQINLSNRVTSIGESVFFYCTKLTSAGDLSSITELGKSAFSHCENLTKVNLSNKLAVIEEYTFSNCGKLTSAGDLSGITKLGVAAFLYCESLTKVNLSNRVTSIGDSAFAECDLLYDAGDLSNLTTIEKGTFSYCTDLVSIKLSNKVTTIEDNAFFSCSDLTAPGDLSNVTTIGKNAFWRCTSLTSLPDLKSVATIGVQAFWDCYNLTAITIHSKVQSIGKSAFQYCSKLENVYCHPSVPPALGEKAFHNGCSALKIHVSPTSADSYKGADGWKDYATRIAGDLE